MSLSSKRLTDDTITITWPRCSFRIEPLCCSDIVSTGSRYEMYARMGHLTWYPEVLLHGCGCAQVQALPCSLSEYGHVALTCRVSGRTHSLLSPGPCMQVHERPSSSMLIFFWLPLGPVVHASMACQVSSMLEFTLADAQKLRQQMHAHLGA